jgi:hypothetical protein
MAHSPKPEHICRDCNGSGADAVKTTAARKRGDCDGAAYIRCHACNGNGLDPAAFFRWSTPMKRDKSLSTIDDPQAFEAAFYGRHGMTPADALRRTQPAARPVRPVSLFAPGVVAIVDGACFARPTEASDPPAGKLETGALVKLENGEQWLHPYGGGSPFRVA